MKRKVFDSAAVLVASLMLVGGFMSSAASAAPLHGAHVTRTAVAENIRVEASQPLLVTPQLTCGQYGTDISFTQSTGVPYCDFWSYVQGIMARPGGYTGAIDGVMGTNSWEGVQRYLNSNIGAGLTVDGVAGTNTNKAIQRWINTFDWVTPVVVDGVRGPATYESWASVLIGLSD